ncbi:hypothetical protein GCM10010922_14460 [Microbacterium sorbitolivorans]|nr:hypothetical protein GCM10010922_14460 [Microbacterium sorbitolivorans]
MSATSRGGVDSGEGEGSRRVTGEGVMSPRPGRIVEEHTVDLPKRRNYADTLELPEFHRVSSRVRELLGASGSEE